MLSEHGRKEGGAQTFFRGPRAIFPGGSAKRVWTGGWGSSAEAFRRRPGPPSEPECRPWVRRGQLRVPGPGCSTEQAGKKAGRLARRRLRRMRTAGFSNLLSMEPTTGNPRPPRIFLVDNGSLRPDATFGLRALAERVGELAGLRVEPVSLLHSNKIPAEDLGGRPASIVEPTLYEGLRMGDREFVFLPLFLGASRAMTSFLPTRIERARQEFPDFRAVIASPLAGPDPENPDTRLADMLADHVGEVIRRDNRTKPKVAMVDHGTPVREVNRLRNAVAGQLEERLGGRISALAASSMERREGDAYAFNEPLLERIDEVPDFAGGDLVVSMFFLLPGRHAGEGGDVEEICRDLDRRGAFRSIVRTPLLGGHPGLPAILRERLEAALPRLGSREDQAGLPAGTG